MKQPEPWTAPELEGGAVADSRTKRYKKPYHLMLDETHQAMLAQLAEANHVPASQIIRQWISNAYRMQFDQEPRCMTGLDCLCPRSHNLDRGPLVTDRELLQRHGGHNGSTYQQTVP
jgi:hypothetical protein